MKTHLRFLNALTITLVFLATRTQANVRLPSIFSDHMVLQAGLGVPVWGWADPGEGIVVSVNSQTQSATADSDGKWQVKFDAMKADESQTLTVRGKNTLVINDVLIGEVWLCSGQSNMALPVTKAADFSREQSAAVWPRIRTFTTKWVVCSPETVGDFSATGYFFGREVHQKTGRAVGLINRSAGGSPIELWTSLEAQKDVAELKPTLEVKEPPKAVSKDAIAQAESDRKQALATEGKQAAAGKKRPPGYLFDDRIAPLIPYAIRGVVWYQGEANSYTVHANLYGRQLAVLITDWRRRWGCEFSFLSVQLPELGRAQTEPVEASGRAFVREGVLQSLSLPNTGMAVTLGTGEEKSNHPVNKQEVGRRLALWALAMVYGQKDVVPSGPLLASHKVDGNQVVISFTHADGGLVAKDGELKGFAIAGKDQKWVWANAMIRGNTVVASHPDVQEPVAVRYAWATNPAGSNLFNGAGLPTSPFRTDDWLPEGKAVHSPLAP